MTNDLSSVQRKRLMDFEAEIETGIKHGMAMGRAFRAIRDDKLYVESAETFDAYCESRWGYKRSRVYQLIDAAEVVDSLSNVHHGGHFIPESDLNSVEVPLPTNERQCRALSSAEPEKRAEVWKAAVERADGKQPTERIVKQVVAELSPSKAAPSHKPTPEPKRKSTPEAEARDALKETLCRLVADHKPVMVARAFYDAMNPQGRETVILFFKEWIEADADEETKAKRGAIVMSFPCKPGAKGEPTKWPLTQGKVDEYLESFPGMDVLKVCRAARQWCIDVPEKQKTYGGMQKFLGAWLTRENNKGNGIASNGRPVTHNDRNQQNDAAIDEYIKGVKSGRF